MAAVLPSLRGSGLKARVHLKIDSGMNRQGLFPSEVGAFLDSIRGIPEIELVGVMTHFACVTEDPATIDFQLGRFLPGRRAGAQGVARRRSPTPPTAPPPCTPRAPTWTWSAAAARSTASRPGRRTLSPKDCVPVLAWKSQVALVKRVAARRGRRLRSHLPSRPPHRRGPGAPRLRRRRLQSPRQPRRGAHQRPPLPHGRAASPWIPSASTWAPTGGVKVGDTVTLIGADGDDRITVEEVAQRVGTINYEITCDIALDRSERVFVNGQD